MEPITDKIDRYLDGKMDAAEQAAFEKEVSANPELQQQIYVQKNLRAGIERAGMKSAIGKSFKQQSLKSKIYKWGIATATVAVVGTAVYFGTQNHSATPNGPDITYELPKLNEDGKPEWANADKNLPTQLFHINPNKDTVLETQSGIVFAIPAGAFIGAQDPVTVEVREAVNPLDIMKGGLSTMSDSNMLETGGMFYINARNGETSLKINPDKPVYANVPTNEIKPGMMLFQGQRRADGSINWKDPKPIEKQLIPVDINTLNFYPKGFLEKVAELGFDANNKKVTDSIYYSYSGRKVFSSADMLLDSMRADSAMKANRDESKLDVSRYYSEPGTDGEINPARIAAIWNDKFQNTIIATKEFEERLQVIFKYCRPDILDLYVNNLDKKLYQIDSIAGNRHSEAGLPEFYQFYMRHDGGISIEQSHLKELHDYFALKQKAVQMAAEETFNARKNKEQKEDQTIDQKRNDKVNNDAERELFNFQNEYNTNLKEAYRQLGYPWVNNPPAPAYYGFNVTFTGWNNVDKYVFESTLNRTTLDYTDPNSGKKAVIHYNELKINVPDYDKYTQVNVYLVPQGLHSFMRVKGEKSNYAEKLDELFTYSLVVIAQKDSAFYSFAQDKVAPGSVDVKLESITETRLKAVLSMKFDFNTNDDFEKEVEYMKAEETYKQQLKGRKKQEEIDAEIMKVIFPCYQPQEEATAKHFEA